MYEFKYSQVSSLATFTCGFQTLLVGTGVHSLDDIREWETKPESANLVPDFYSDKLGDIATLLAKAGVNK